MLDRLACALFLAAAVAAHAADLKVLSGTGARSAVIGLVTTFDRATGHKTTVEFAVNPETKAKIEDGQAFDVAILNPPVLDDLIRKGLIVPATRSVIGRAGIGVAVRARAPETEHLSLPGPQQRLLTPETCAWHPGSVN